MKKKTYETWECGRATPDLKALPKVVRTLAYDPTPPAPGARVAQEGGARPVPLPPFASDLLLVRRRLGLSQPEVAARLGVCLDVIGNWERGHGWPWRCGEALRELFQEAGVPIDEATFPRRKTKPRLKPRRRS